MKKLFLVAIILCLSVPAWSYEISQSTTFGGNVTAKNGITVGETLGPELAGQTCAEYTYAGATTCTDAPLTFTRTASATNLTITQTTQTIVPGTLYELGWTATVTASTMSSTIGGIAGATQAASGTFIRYAMAGTNGKLLFTFTATSTGTITAPTVKAVTSTITSADAAPVTFTGAKTSATENEALVTIGASGTKAAGSLNLLELNDTGSGVGRYGIWYNVLGAVKFFVTSTGVLNTSSSITSSNGVFSPSVLGTTMTLNSNNILAAIYGVTAAPGTFTGAGVAQGALDIAPIINQTSTSSFTGLRIRHTETAVGSGAQKLISGQSGAAGTTEVFAVSNTGIITAAGGSTGHATCWKAGGVIGYCSTVVAADGTCTCN